MIHWIWLLLIWNTSFSHLSVNRLYGIQIKVDEKLCFTNSKMTAIIDIKCQRTILGKTIEITKKSGILNFCEVEVLRKYWVWIHTFIHRWTNISVMFRLCNLWPLSGFFWYGVFTLFDSTTQLTEYWHSYHLGTPHKKDILKKQTLNLKGSNFELTLHTDSNIYDTIPAHRIYQKRKWHVQSNALYMVTPYFRTKNSLQRLHSKNAVTNEHID